LPTRFTSGRFFHGHRRFHLHQFIHVIKDTYAAAVVDRLLHFRRGCYGIDVQMGQTEPEMRKILLQAFGQPLGDLVVFSRQIEDGINRIPHEIIQARHDDLVEVLFDALGGKHALGAHHAVDEQYRLNHLQVENAESTQPDEAQFTVFEGHGITGTPFQVGEHLHIDKVHLGPQRTFHAPWQAGDLGEYGDVAGRQGMSPRSKGFDGFTFIEEYAYLAITHRQLGTPLDLSRAFLRHPVDQFFT